MVLGEEPRKGEASAGGGDIVAVVLRLSYFPCCDAKP